MLSSELRAQLEALEREHGDLPVLVPDENMDFFMEITKATFDEVWVGWDEEDNENTAPSILLRF